MMNNVWKKLPVLLVAAPLFFVTACTSISDDPSGDAVVEDRTGGATGQSGEGYEGQTGGYDDSGMGSGSAMNGQSYSGDPLSDPNSPLSARTIYFEYDSTVINSEGQSALNAHAEYLSLNSDKQIIIEGHTDERGTREYNLSLGERRSNAVADFLSASGVPGQQLEVRSYGEENPMALDHNDSAWQLNRRVELLY
ncbi:MAG: peptidoglycan-associated lipoprotein Pal [Gammaproteobacteria bacterium]|nr:peptidoglycan-associated lipoprotein Pal [Gammaproteobacteria bacterium]